MLSPERCPGCEHRNVDREGMCIRLWSFFARRQKLGVWLERESGMTTTANLPCARFTQAGKSRSRHGTTEGRAEANRGWSAVQPSFPTLIPNDSHRFGIIRARLL
jgi:hypothetical protein